MKQLNISMNKKRCYNCGIIFNDNFHFMKFCSQFCAEMYLDVVCKNIVPAYTEDQEQYKGAKKFICKCDCK